MSGLPTGLAGAHSALTSAGSDALARLTTLVWLRVLTDPSCPLIGGNDPRRILDPPLTWDEILTFRSLEIDVLCARLNTVMQEELLSVDWSEVPDETIGRALHEVGRWQMPAGDPLGVAYTHLISKSKASAIGSFFTPYEVSLMMAMMTSPEPGASVCDPCCGSGGMLLAALEAVRKEHGPTAGLEIYGMDIDPDAVRLARLNLALAGYGPNDRIYPTDSLDSAPPAIRPALEAARDEYEQGQLF